MQLSCPKCRETNIRKSRRKVLDFLLSSFGFVPLRCNVCCHRFFRFRASLRHAGPSSSSSRRAGYNRPDATSRSPSFESK